LGGIGIAGVEDVRMLYGTVVVEFGWAFRMRVVCLKGSELEDEETVVRRCK
jgi:hypothetical protein